MGKDRTGRRVGPEPGAPPGRVARKDRLKGTGRDWRHEMLCRQVKIWEGLSPSDFQECQTFPYSEFGQVSDIVDAQFGHDLMTVILGGLEAHFKSDSNLFTG